MVNQLARADFPCCILNFAGQSPTTFAGCFNVRAVHPPLTKGFILDGSGLAEGFDQGTVTAFNIAPCACIIAAVLQNTG
ncbi:MAG TPA: hypothetical protein PKC98_23160, partial [Candidatus Melainabacteria bacterium]|nr:hypothetical protein [Candidatus Melainabacteria bacterium]